MRRVILLGIKDGDLHVVTSASLPETRTALDWVGSWASVHQGYDALYLVDVWADDILDWRVYEVHVNHTVELKAWA